MNSYFKTLVKCNMYYSISPATILTVFPAKHNYITASVHTTVPVLTLMKQSCNMYKIYIHKLFSH